MLLDNYVSKDSGLFLTKTNWGITIKQRRREWRKEQFQFLLFIKYNFWIFDHDIFLI